MELALVITLRRTDELARHTPHHSLNSSVPGGWPCRLSVTSFALWLQIWSQWRGAQWGMGEVAAPLGRPRPPSSLDLSYSCFHSLSA